MEESFEEKVKWGEQEMRAYTQRKNQENEINRIISAERDREWLRAFRAEVNKSHPKLNDWKFSAIFIAVALALHGALTPRFFYTSWWKIDVILAFGTIFWGFARWDHWREMRRRERDIEQMAAARLSYNKD
jgi:hypothetical protein